MENTHDRYLRSLYDSLYGPNEFVRPRNFYPKNSRLPSERNNRSSEIAEREESTFAAWLWVSGKVVKWLRSREGDLVRVFPSRSVTTWPVRQRASSQTLVRAPNAPSVRPPYIISGKMHFSSRGLAAFRVDKEHELFAGGNVTRLADSFSETPRSSSPRASSTCGPHSGETSVHEAPMKDSRRSSARTLEGW